VRSRPRAHGPKIESAGPDGTTRGRRDGHSASSASAWGGGGLLLEIFGPAPPLELFFFSIDVQQFPHASQAAARHRGPQRRYVGRRDDGYVPDLCSSTRRPAAGRETGGGTFQVGSSAKEGTAGRRDHGAAIAARLLLAARRARAAAPHPVARARPSSLSSSTTYVAV